MYAASVGHIDILNWLVEQGADLEKQNEVSTHVRTLLLLLIIMLMIIIIIIMIIVIEHIIITVCSRYFDYLRFSLDSLISYYFLMINLFLHRLF